MTNNCISKYIFLNDKLELKQDLNLKKAEHIIYDVLRIKNNTALFQEEHAARFFNSFKLLNQDQPFTSDFLKKAIKKFLTTEKIQEGNIKYSYYIGNKRDFIIYQIPHSYPTKDEYKTGVPSDILQAERKTPNIKQELNIRKLANNQITQKKLYDIILCDKTGKIKEGSRTNLFFIKDNTIYTAHDKDVLIGITRQNLIKVSEELTIKLIKTNIHTRELQTYEAAFFTGTSPKILPISNIGDINYNAKHPTLLKLMKAFDKKINVYLQLNK